MDTPYTMAIMFRDERSVSTKFVRPHGLTVFVLSKYYFWTQNAEARKEKEKTSALFGNSSKVQHLSPCSCNKSALAQYQPYTKELQPNSGCNATLQPGQVLFYQISYASLLLTLPLDRFMRRNRPPSSILAYYRTNKKTPHLTTNGCTALYSLE